MGRPNRIKAPDVTFHIVSRTNGKKLFMKKGRDRQKMCQCLQKISLKYRAKIYGFTPMCNHFHLIIKMTEDGDISKFMCEFKVAYAKYFNTKYNTSGHFWGDRFKSTIIQDDKHMLACLRYIDRNPLNAKLVDNLCNWEYATYQCYAYHKQHSILAIELHPTYMGLSSDPEKRRNIYIEYVSGEDYASEGLRGTMEKKQFFGSPEFVQSFK